MARDTMTAVEALRKGHEVEPDFLREVVRWTVQELMEAEVSAQIGAERYERAGERTTYRNGYRAREWDTRVGTLELAVPKLRTGSYVPSWLEPRRRSEQALVAVVTEAYVQGVSTRKVETLVQALGIVGISKSEVSRLCASLDEQVEAFRSRRLDTARYPYLWLDARYEYVREDHQVQSMAVVIAYGVRDDGVREVLGLDIGPSEDTPLWRGFLQSLVARGLRGVRLVISDAHRGLKQAIREVFVGAGWQRCRVHTIRTQSHNRWPGRRWSLGRAAERNDMADLQPVVVDDYTLDEELQDRLLVLEGGLGQPAAHPLTEGSQVGEDGLGLRPLAA